MISQKMIKVAKVSSVLMFTAMLGACASLKEASGIPVPPKIETTNVGTGGQGTQFLSFLEKSDYPDFVYLFDPPPAEGSELFANDVKVYKETRKLKGTEIWNDAAKGANLSPDYICEYFSPVLSREINSKDTPWVYYIIARSVGDAIKNGTGGIKNTYMRVRPYVYFKDRTCSTKEDDDKHVNSGSYPSGHTTYIQLVALILSELDPAHEAEIIKRANQYADYRVICGFHWKSDIELGKKVAPYVFARLHADRHFTEAMTQAKKYEF